MKKILIAMLLLCGIVGQVKAQEEYGPKYGWLVVKDGVPIETSDKGEGEFSSLSEIDWIISRFPLPKGTLVPNGLEYISIFGENGERREPRTPDGYIYFQGEMDGDECMRIKKDGLKKVQLSSCIPLKYGDGKVHKAENGMSFKIVPFKSSAKLKFDTSEFIDIRPFKRFIKGQKCYMLMVMSSTGKVEHVELLEKTSNGFINAHHKYQQFSQKEPKVNAQGLLTTQWKLVWDETEWSFVSSYWAWVKDENALVGISEVEPMPGQYIIPFLKVAK